MDSPMESAFKGHLLLTLVDHAKPFKGMWQIYRQGETIYSACHSPAPSGAGEPADPCCQAFSTNKQVCQFAELLQFYGWSVEGQTPDSMTFLQSCAL
jgi:hypothetical protein